MKKTKLDKLPMAAAMLLVVLIVAACAIRLRDDENQTTSATSADQASDPLAAKLAECRSVTSEQKEALSECRKAWAEKRRQFLRQTSPTSSEGTTSHGTSPLFIPSEHDSGPRLGPHDSVPQSGKD
ncbi:putative entry exclusion protein TrbK-alt [Bradyrhizobium valentinum]|uniref:putative entry exclusion protein TrbK-alt n=1 Tax=Bradyrhizobium valentinum TaxID=1518501 RepID=UPI0009EA7B86|nr:putative entry exclusion protein TrbK-alt [Bradyrhizobium valentinum]